MEEGKLYHIFNRGNNKENIFLSKNNYIFFLEKYKFYLSQHADTISYCLMPNHFHFLIRIKEFTDQTSEVLKTSEVSAKLTPVEKAFKDFFISYAKAFNKENKRTGSLFQSKFKKKEIDSHSYLSSIIAYIHLNPVKAHFCKTPQEWKYSSYNSILSSKPTAINKNEALKWFGDHKDFVDFHIHYKEEYTFQKYLID